MDSMMTPFDIIAITVNGIAIIYLLQCAWYYAPFRKTPRAKV